ncbi:MAG: YdbH domain-containing protein [Alcanivorax sp.]|uniref:YdbH domain-containing protein n=1 Tax=Alcanivorax sp. TaxID=1872427 RepID=UPI0032D9564F
MLFLALVAAGWLYSQGLRVSKPGWDNGLTLAHWRWQPDDCAPVAGENLVLRDLFPLTVHTRTVTLTTCDSGADDDSVVMPDSLPWTPPFVLSIDTLLLPAMGEVTPPQLQVAARQQQQHWLVKVESTGSHLKAEYERDDGQWSLHGNGALNEWLTDWQGTWQLEGDGVWQGQPAGTLSATLQDAGLQSQPQKADLAMKARFTGEQWQADMSLSEPLSLNEQWQLAIPAPLSLQGQGIALLQARGQLQLQGPPGQVHVSANSDDGTVEKGAGRVMLTGPELDGQLDFQWQDQMLTLSPATLALPEQLSAQWKEPLQVPMALDGVTDLPLLVGYHDLRLKASPSRLQWQGKHWQWQGALGLQGRWQGFRLDGHWQGQAASDGLQGKPITLNARNGDDRLAFRLPLESLHRAPYGGKATVKGQYAGYPLDGSVSFRQADDGWQGTLSATSSIPDYDRGGDVSLQVPWHLKDSAVVLADGSRLSVSEGLVEQVLLRPLTVTASGPVTVSSAGAHGHVQLRSGGLLAARWRLPVVAGSARLIGKKVTARLTIADWQSELTADASLAGDVPRGSFQVHSQLIPAMGQGLAMTPQEGTLAGKGSWQWRDTLSAQGSIRLADTGMDWGSVTARGIQGTMEGHYRDGAVSLKSVGPVTTDILDIGTPITDLSLQVESDLTRWQFSDIQADLLGGSLRSPALDWPSPRPQPVVITRIDLEQVAALQNPPAVFLDGRVGGYVPLQLGTNFMVVEGARLANEETLSLRIPPSSSVQSMAGSNQAVKLALDSLSVLTIPDFQARMNMDREGWLDAAVTIKGRNPQRKNLPVVFNYTHRENMLVLMRSLRIGDDITEKLRTERSQ